MDQAQTYLVLREGRRVARLEATRIRFSAHQCFARDGGVDDLRCLRILVEHLCDQPAPIGVCIAGDGAFFKYMLAHFPSVRSRVACVIVEKLAADGAVEFEGLPVVPVGEIPDEVHTVFLCETLTYPRMRMRKWFPPQTRLVEPDVLQELALDELPARAWTPWARDIIYPMDLPDFEFHAGMDLIVIDCPARNLGLMPNGLGYVHNALKEVDVRYQICDLDILLYHRFHVRRLFDEGGTITLSSGRALPSDPWQAEHYDLWSDAEVIAHFEPEIAEIVDKLTAARPKVLGLSIHACNEKFSATVVERLKAALPELIVLVGGFSCYSPDIGLRGFPLADYMCIGEADLTVGPLVERLAHGDRPANTPGILSKFDQPETPFLPAPMVHDLDLLVHPKYEWYDLGVYRNYNGYQLTPVIASRGCRWSRCTFCAERFYWRIRSAKAFVDELQWLVDQGCRLFMFNESDLNGKPEAVLEICDEIIRRGLKVKLTGQLRIHKKCDRAYFQKLRQAGFVALRFGVDAFSENTLRLQKKGYTTATVCQNLKDCWEAGIYSEVNWVIGVPGETEQDIDEGIELILRNKPYIGRLANINPLILVTGGVYWLEPEEHNIHFRGDKEELYRTHPRAIPAHMWYSTEPYIDEKVRKDRFERIVLALHEGHFNVGAWAERVIEDVKLHRDSNRAGPKEEKGKLSAGVGSMEPAPPPEEGALEFNADARSSAYVFRAGSALPEDKTRTFRSTLCVVASRGELFGVEPAALKSAFGQLFGARATAMGATLDMRAHFQITMAKTKTAAAELVQSVGTYNIVSYDAKFFAVPQGVDAEMTRAICKQLREHAPNLRALQRPLVVRMLRRAARIVIDWAKSLAPWRTDPGPSPIPWGDVDVARLPGVFSGTSLPRLIALVERLLGIGGTVQKPSTPEQETTERQIVSLRTIVPPGKQRDSKPHLVGALEGYNIVEYEGWFYGIPQALGDFRLEEVDGVETPGVIRDLSREVVEGEIRELTRTDVSPQPAP